MVGFVLKGGKYSNKSEFRDALCLKYNWQQKNVAQHCVCRVNLSTDHVMICPHGGMTIIRHNEIRDINLFNQRRSW